MLFDKLVELTSRRDRRAAGERRIAEINLGAARINIRLTSISDFFPAQMIAALGFGAAWNVLNNLPAPDSSGNKIVEKVSARRAHTSMQIRVRPWLILSLMHG